MATETGIRSYGPGKFNNIIDEYVYEACLNQGTPDEEISHEGFGWYALLHLDTSARDFIREIAADKDDVLTDDEQDLISESKALILHERDDGIVGVDWYDKLAEAKKVWADLEEELESNEDERDDDGSSDPSQVEFSVEDGGGRERIFKTFDEAAGFAVSLAASQGKTIDLDVLIWSPAGARAYGGDDAVEQYFEDPEASIFERIEIRADAVGRVA